MQTLCIEPLLYNGHHYWSEGNHKRSPWATESCNTGVSFRTPSESQIQKYRKTRITPNLPPFSTLPIRKKDINCISFLLLVLWDKKIKTHILFQKKRLFLTLFFKGKKKKHAEKFCHFSKTVLEMHRCMMKYFLGVNESRAILVKSKVTKHILWCCSVWLVCATHVWIHKILNSHYKPEWWREWNIPTHEDFNSSQTTQVAEDLQGSQYNDITHKDALEWSGF